MDVSNDLFQIAGLFQRYRDTGGVISAQEARFLSSRLGALAEGVHGLEIALKATSDEFDAYVEAQGGAADMPPIRMFNVIAGGKS